MLSGGKDEGLLKDRLFIYIFNMIEWGVELCDDFFVVCVY